MGKDSHDDKKKRKIEEDKEAKQKKENEGLLGYSNTANPWGDSNLTEKFVWKLKREKEAAEGKQENSQQDELSRRQDIEREVEKVKERRLKREMSRKQMDEERQKKQRLADMDAHQDWEKQEDAFLLQQAKIRSEIRIRDGRPKPIDILFKNINRDNAFEVEQTQPYDIFKNLSVAELEELKKDITMYLQLDSHKDFWEALLVVNEGELEHKNNQQRKEAEGVHRSVTADVTAILEGKSYEELATLEGQIREKLDSGSVDVEYWEGLLKKLKIYKSKARLRQIHEQLVKESKNIQKDKTEEEKKQIKEEPKYKREQPSEIVIKYEAPEVEELPQHRFAFGEEPPTMEQRRTMLLKEAQKLRDRTEKMARPDDKMLTEEEMYHHEANLGMDESEETFNEDYPLLEKTYSWDDKYRPRKPKFFNRIHTGFEWNKYNQTHYDHDNPPPRTVQGYKFNIFFPDLIDKSKAPQYFLEKAETPDYVILRFHAGPPYEDIAFKIMNIEWDYSYKLGYRCAFERGILHLWFQFRKYRYKR